MAHGMTLKIMGVQLEDCQRAVVLLSAIVEVVLHILRFEHWAQVLGSTPPGTSSDRGLGLVIVSPGI